MFLLQQLVLKNGTINYENWIETPIPMYFELYLFNWTNPEQIHEWRTVKPHFTELGPYVFLEKHYRRNVVFHDNDTVTFNTERVYEFLEDMSTGSLEDEVTNINPIDVVSFRTVGCSERG
jgi:scavenger receptor class B, member 1